jgi:hypothetical protein
MRAVLPGHPDEISGLNSRPLSPRASMLPGRMSPSDGPPPQQPIVFSDGYAPVESLPPQNYIVPARTLPHLPAHLILPASHGTSVLSQAHPTSPHVQSIPSPSAVIPLNSELALPPRFTFAPPGEHVPADPVVSAAATTPTSAGSRREKVIKGKSDTASQPTQEGSGSRVRSNSWSVFPSVFRRRSGV